MSGPLKHKRGTTLRIAMTIKVDGVAVNLTAHTLSSFARLQSDTSDGAPLATAIVTKDDQALRPGRVFVDFGVTTSAWPIGRVNIDVKYVNTDTDATPTFQIDVERGITT